MKPLVGRVHLEVLERLERAVCEAFDHRWREERAGAPVTEFRLCGRCGKIGDRL